MFQPVLNLLMWQFTEKKKGAIGF